MKALLYSAAFAILVSTPVFSADDSVSLVGTWTGQRDRIAKIEGRRGGLATLVITEQQGNTFVGRLKRSNPTGDEEEPLWGAFTPGGKLMMGSDDEGTYQSDRSEYPRLLLQRDWRLSAIRVRKTDPPALKNVRFAFSICALTWRWKRSLVIFMPQSVQSPGPSGVPRSRSSSWA